MLKFAFEVGVKIALAEEGLSPAQMSAAQGLGAVGGGGAGALGGSLLGKYLGEKVAPTLGVKDVERAKLIGGLLGGVAGAGLGGFAGHQLPKLLKQREEGMALAPQYFEGPQMAEAPSGYPMGEQSALGLLPSAYDYGGAMPAEYSYYPEY